MQALLCTAWERVRGVWTYLVDIYKRDAEQELQPFTAREVIHELDPPPRRIDRVVYHYNKKGN